MARRKAKDGDVMSFPLTMTCGGCEGKGQIKSHIWTAWFEQQQRAEMEKRDKEPPPDAPMMVTCQQCGGLGQHVSPSARDLVELIGKMYGLTKG